MKIAIHLFLGKNYGCQRWKDFVDSRIDFIECDMPSLKIYLQEHNTNVHNKSYLLLWAECASYLNLEINHESANSNQNSINIH